MTRFPMMLQLMLSLFCVMAIPLAILTWYSDAEILRNSESAIAETSLAGLNASRKLNENALSNLAQDVVRLAVTKVFDRIRDFETYDEVNADYNNVRNAQVVLQELLNLNHRVNGVYSSFFYLQDTDYVVSTDKGITMLERYESLDWMGEALDGKRGISGVWVPRKVASGEHVISYVLPLNRLSTTTRGTIVVNVKESQIAEYLRASEPGTHGYLLLDADGTIISHSDKSLLFTDAGELPFIREILQHPSKEGYVIREVVGERLIYAWSQSELFGWRNVNVYSMNELLTKAHKQQRSIHAVTAIIIVAGTVMTVFLATWLSKPVRQLVRAVRVRSNVRVSNKNELVFLDAAFRRMQEEEEKLYKLLEDREQETRSLAVHHLLRGEVTEQTSALFPEPYYRVAVISIDRYRRYEGTTNPETRNYHRYILISQCESLFPDRAHARCVYYGDGCFAIVMNYGKEEHHRNLEGINKSLAAIREKASELLGQSVTIGVSSETETSSQIYDRVVEAMEAIKYRLIEGTGKITFWRKEPGRNKKYIYPANSERRILNFLDSGDLDSMTKELELIRNEIRSVEYISYDNILFIYNQLAGVTIKHLRENHVHAARMFAGRENIYSAIASFDTLDELEDYLKEFFSEIVKHLERNPGDVDYGQRIIRYLEEHFREEIVFEEMAKEIGISYSYMRKIAYETTGKSLTDYMNLLRIRKAKQMLLESNLSIAQIAAEAGYANIQSFNRFFRKFEGMSPSSYKSLKLGTSEREPLL